MLAVQEQGMEMRQASEATLLSRRTVIAGLAAAGTGVLHPVQAAGTSRLAVAAPGTGLRMGFVLSHEQFPVPELVQYGSIAEQAGFDMVWTSDHFQPWQSNQRHAGFAWVTLAAVSQQTKRGSYGTGVSTPTFRHRPALIAEAVASLSLLSPGRAFLGLDTGEKRNRGAAGCGWALYPERAARLVEAVQIIRQLWSGQQVKYNGTYYTVDARLYDVPAHPIPIYIAAGGPKNAHLSGIHADGLIADPAQLKQNPAYKAAWEEGARSVGKDPTKMPILLEHFVSVSGVEEAKANAEKWRFLPKAWKPGYFNNISPMAIQKRAESEIPLSRVYGSWAVSTDPHMHVQAIQKWVDLGVTHIFVHSAQANQPAVVDFFGKQVMPLVRGGGITGVRQVTMG